MAARTLSALIADMREEHHAAPLTMRQRPVLPGSRPATPIKRHGRPRIRLPR